MRRQKMRRQTIRAALVALAAGSLVAVADPAPRISHDAEAAMTSARQLAIQSAHAMTRELRG